VDDIYGIMTRRAIPVAAPAATQTGFATPLHPVGTNLMAGLLETLNGAPYFGRADLPALAAALQYEADELLPLGETLGLLGFAVLEEGDLILTETGRKFAEAETDDRKIIFAAQVKTHVPLISAISAVLAQRSNHRASSVRFRDELEDHMSPEYADETLRTAIAWGRYAELFEYDEEAQQFGLEEEDEDDE
jgi:NitT/TauT family transport system ATP-binding protein